jgi:histidyl-tRNA synthetase
MSVIQCPRGMQDLYGEDLHLRNKLIQIASSVFQTRGGIYLETPNLERIDTIKNMYGENFNKEVYWIDNKDDNKDGEAEKLLLRYDLTVPAARFIGSIGRVNFKRYQIGKVYRRDQPNISQGRFREFWQCDFDIYGNDNDFGIYDFEILDTMVELLEKMIGENKFIIKLNSRDVIFQILKLCKVPDDKIPTTTSTLDKLDKKTVEEIKIELIEKSLESDIITNISLMIDQLQQTIKTNSDYFSNKIFTPPKSMIRVWNLLSKTNIAKYFMLDPLLSRGLDYYTGIIYEAKYIDASCISTTIASGGRYDNMVEKFSTKGKIPAIGLSIGIERIMKILNPTLSLDPLFDVFVATTGKFTIHDPIEQRMILTTRLRKSGLRVDYSTGFNPKFGTQLQKVFELKIPIMVVIGESEIEKSVYQVKNINLNKQTEVSSSELESFIFNILKMN